MVVSAEATQNKLDMVFGRGSYKLGACLLQREEQGHPSGRLTVTEVRILNYDPGVKKRYRSFLSGARFTGECTGKVCSQSREDSP